MNLPNKQSLFISVTVLMLNNLAALPLIAEPVYHPSGAKLTFGGMTNRQLNVSDMGNPAHPASIPYPQGSNSLYGGGLSIGLGIEYDGNDNLFTLLDNAGSNNTTIPGGGNSNSGQDGSTLIPNLPPIGSNLDPAVQAALEAAIDEVTVALAVVAASVTSVNAKAFVSADLPILISNNTFGGTWTLGANYSITTNLRGLNDPINFDSNLAKQNLTSAFTANTNTAVTYDLSGGASITVNPDGSTKFRIDNNSGVITKAAQITEISIGYSRKIWQKDENTVYIGVKPKIYDVGLSNAAIPIANIDKAKDIFDALDNSSFKFEQDFAVDFGAIWSGKQYQVGATVTNLNEPDFQFPATDISGFTNPVIIQAIRDSEQYVMERQLKLDGGYISSSGAWGINFGLDANAVPDPMGDNYQWASVGVGFASDSWWLPGARVGLRKNLSGTELSYITAGITLFNIVNLDIASTTETVHVDGKTIPQGLIANLSMQVVF